MELAKKIACFNRLKPASGRVMRECARDMCNPEEIQQRLEAVLVPELLKFNSGELAEFAGSIIAETTVRELAKAIVGELKKERLKKILDEMSDELE